MGHMIDRFITETDLLTVRLPAPVDGLAVWAESESQSNRPSSIPVQSVPKRLF
jgi:hypothetical protein